jgi:hypothetical protein
MLYTLTTHKKKIVNNDLKRRLFILTGKFHWDNVNFSIFIFSWSTKKKQTLIEVSSRIF